MNDDLVLFHVDVDGARVASNVPRNEATTYLDTVRGKPGHRARVYLTSRGSLPDKLAHSAGRPRARCSRLSDVQRAKILVECERDGTLVYE